MHVYTTSTHLRARCAQTHTHRDTHSTQAYTQIQIRQTAIRTPMSTLHALKRVWPKLDKSCTLHTHRNKHVRYLAVCGRMLQCVAVCCSVLQCVAVCCSVLQCVAVSCVLYTRRKKHIRCFAVYCSVLQCVEVCSSVLRAATILCRESSTYVLCVYVHTGLLRSIHCNLMQHAATHCNTSSVTRVSCTQYTTFYCNTLQHAATHCNTVQHIECDTSLLRSIRPAA